MKTIVEYLKELDLSETEAKIYLTLIENGPKRVRELAELVGLKRTTAYLYIESLVSKGLISEDVKESGARISANPPQRLKYLVEQKVKTANELHQELPAILSNINTSFSQIKASPEETEIKYLKGINSVKAIYEEAFKGNEIRSYVKVAETPTLSSDNTALFNKAFQRNKNLKMWEIIYDSPFSRRQAINLVAQNNKGYFCKFMPSNLKWSTREDILIYDGKVVIINYGGKVISIILKNIDFYNNSKELFDFIWKMMPA